MIESQKYTIIRELGRGGMGVVYLAEDRQLKRAVALKVLYEHLNRDRAFVERFQEEARSVSTLHHPNIVCVHGLEQAGETIAIDMEYVEGQALDRLRVSTRMNTHMVAGIAGDVLSGLTTCHQIGVVHRDMKPSNILIAQNGQAKITDFGLATAYASHLEATTQLSTSSGFYMGTPRYMPPQAWEGDRAEPFWDLYSFGVVLFELITGRVAFEGSNPMAIMRQHLTDPLPAVGTVSEQVSPAFAALVDRLIATTRDSDISLTAADALDELRTTPEFMDLNESNAPTTVSLPRVRATSTVPAKGPTRTLFRALPLVGLVLVVVLAAAYLMYSGEPVATPPAETTAAEAPPAPPPATVPDTAPQVFFEVVAINNEEYGEGTWMIERDGQGNPTRITGLSALELWSISVEPSDDRQRHRIHGDWGAFYELENGKIHCGPLEGFLYWDPVAGFLTVHARCTNARDNMSVDLSLKGQRKPVEYDRTAFLRELESSESIQGLLYRELLERRLAWAAGIEGMLPSLPNSRTAVPYVDAAPAIDGVLDDDIWTRPQFNASGRIGELNAQSAGGEPKLLLRWSANSVCIAARAPWNDPGTATFEISLLPALELSHSRSGRFVVSFDSLGSRQHHYYVNGRERPWPCDWEGKVRAEGDEVVAEIRIPLDLFKEDGFGMPRDGKRWRMNARLSRAKESSAAPWTVSWGDEDLEALEHGALIIFEDARS